MPIIIAGLVYTVLLVPAVAGCLIWGAVPLRELVAGGAGSVAGFVTGCVGAMTATLFNPGVDVSATLVVTALALIGAAAGALLGVVLRRRVRSRI